MKVIVDRLEDKYAVCETANRRMINIEKTRLPKDIKEGDTIIIDRDYTIIGVEKTPNDNQRLFNKLKRRNVGRL